MSLSLSLHCLVFSAYFMVVKNGTSLQINTFSECPLRDKGRTDALQMHLHAIIQNGRSWRRNTPRSLLTTLILCHWGGTGGTVHLFLNDCSSSSVGGRD